MAEKDYLRATDRVIATLNEEEIRELAFSEDREEYLQNFIKTKFENSDNMIEAVFKKLDEKFESNYEKRYWKGMTLNEVLDTYKEDIIKREREEKEREKITQEISDYERIEKKIREKHEQLKKETISKMEKNLIEKNEKAELKIIQKRLSGAARYKLYKEGKLII